MNYSVQKNNKDMTKANIKTADEVINDITEVLRQADDKFIEEIANKILTNKVKYLTDSMFEEKIEKG